MKKKQQNKKIILGLTGSFGSGKSTVAKILRSYGAKIIDADKIGSVFLKRATNEYRKIVSAFGEKILDKSGSINRMKLSRVVFADGKALKILDSILHPVIIQRIKDEIKSAKSKVIVIDAPLLIEAGLDKLADRLLVVSISRKNQISRLKKKYKLTKEEIIQRIQSQIPLKRKENLADFIIDNNGTKNETEKQIKPIRRLLWRS